MRSLVYALFYLIIILSLVFPFAIPQIYQTPIGRGCLLILVFIWGYYGSFLLGLLAGSIFILSLSYQREGMTTIADQTTTTTTTNKNKKQEKQSGGVDLETIKTSLQAQNSKYLANPSPPKLTHPVSPSPSGSQLASSNIK